MRVLDWKIWRFVGRTCHLQRQHLHELSLSSLHPPGMNGAMNMQPAQMLAS
jgi:hypothetical protein